MLRRRWLELARCRVDLDDGAVAHHDGGTDRLTASEVRLVAYLAAHPDAAHTRDALLERVWGYAPAVLSRTVEVTVRRVRQKIEVDPSNPDHLLTDRGSGYRFRPLATTAGGERPEPPVRPVVRHNVRPSPTPLVGRADDLAALAALADAGRGVVGIVGPPGVGKSRLARAYAEQVIQAGRHDEVWWCDLDGVPDVAGAAARVADAIGADDDATPALVGRMLRDRGRVLLVADHAEGVDGGGAWLRTLADQALGSTLIACSRRVLGVGDGAEIRMAPLDPEASLALFDARVRDARGAGLSPEEQPDADAIGRALDGLPLGIELAAGRAALLSIGALRAHVTASLALLSRPGPAWRTREATLDGALAASIDALAPDARAVLLQCALFAAPFPLAAVLAASPLDNEAATIAAFDALAEHCLVQLHPARGGPNHLTLLGPIRTFARARLAADPRAPAAADRHQRWVLDQARRGTPAARAAALDLAEVVARLAGRDRAEPEVRAAWAEATLALVDATPPGRSNPREAALLDALDPAGLPAAVRVRWMDQRAQVCAAMGETARAERLVRDAVALAQAEAPEMLDRARLQLGRFLSHVFAPADAIAVLEQVGPDSAALRVAFGRADRTVAVDPEVHRACVRLLAALRRLTGRVADGAATLAALGPSRSWEDDHEWGRQLGDEGKFAEALARFDEALARLDAHDDRFEPRLRNARATALCRLGRFDEAEAELSAASIVAARLGQVYHAAVLSSNAAALVLARGDHARAAVAFAEVRETARQLGHAYLAETAAGNLAVCALDAGRLDEAATALDAVIAALDDRAMVQVATVYRCYRVLAAVLRGEPDAGARGEALATGPAPAEPTALVRATVALAAGGRDSDAVEALVGAMRRIADRAEAAVTGRCTGSPPGR